MPLQDVLVHPNSSSSQKMIRSYRDTKFSDTVNDVFMFDQQKHLQPPSTRMIIILITLELGVRALAMWGSNGLCVHCIRWFAVFCLHIIDRKLSTYTKFTHCIFTHVNICLHNELVSQSSAINTLQTVIWQWCCGTECFHGAFWSTWGSRIFNWKDEDDKYLHHGQKQVWQKKKKK